MTGSKPVALPLGYAPSLYCAGRVVLHSRRACSARRLPVVDRELEREIAVRQIDAARHEHFLVRRPQSARVGRPDRRRARVVARGWRACRRCPAPCRRQSRGRESRAANAAGSRRAATSRAAPRARPRDPSTCASRRAPSRVSASGGPATCSTPLRSGPRTASSSASSCWRQLKLPWNPPLTGVDGEPAAHLPGADGVERRAPLIEAEPVAADGQRSARAERRRGQRAPGPRARSWREPLVDLLQVSAVGVRCE